MFGCVAHAHVPDARRMKLEDKSRSCVLFRMSAESKGYRLYDPICKKITVSRDVIFEEDKKWNWDESYEEQINLDLEWGANESHSESEEEELTNEGEAKNPSQADPIQATADPTADAMAALTADQIQATPVQANPI